MYADKKKNVIRWNLNSFDLFLGFFSKFLITFNAGILSKYFLYDNFYYDSNF